MFICSLALFIAGCVSSSTQPSVGTTEMRIAWREGMSPRGARIALASFGGASEVVADRFTYLFHQAAERRDIDLIADAERDGGKTGRKPESKPNYFLRAYLSATPDDGGTLVAAVWDIFDASKNRLQRLKNMRFIKAGAADPWSVVSDATLQDLATNAAENLAAFLSNMPEAQPRLLQANNARTPVEGRAVSMGAQPNGDAWNGQGAAR